MNDEQRLRWDLGMVHQATLIIESSRGVLVEQLSMALIRVNMISAALHIIHGMRQQQRAELKRGHTTKAAFIGLFADIADDMLDTVLRIDTSRSGDYAEASDS